MHRMDIMNVMRDRVSTSFLWIAMLMLATVSVAAPCATSAINHLQHHLDFMAFYSQIRQLNHCPDICQPYNAQARKQWHILIIPLLFLRHFLRTDYF